MRRWEGLPLRLELVGGRRPIWRTLAVLSYRSGVEGSSRGLCLVPAGWVTDLTSIPWWVPWKRREGAHTAASVVHDWIYAKGYTLTPREPVDRSRADRIYLEAMLSLGVRPRLARVIYLGVRLGGWRPWRRYRSRD